MDKEEKKIRLCTHTHRHTYNGILLSYTKDEILQFATTWMDLDGVMISEIIQTDTDRYFTISLLCGIKKSYKQIKTKSMNK